MSYAIAWLSALPAMSSTMDATMALRMLQNKT